MPRSILDGFWYPHLPAMVIDEMSFDVTQNANIVAALQARCDANYPTQGANFKLATMTPTQRTRGDSKYQMSIDVNPARDRAAIAWTAVYRGTVLVGRLIVCNVEQEALAEAMLLAEAVEQFDLIDQKVLGLGASTALYPATAPGY